MDKTDAVVAVDNGGRNGEGELVKLVNDFSALIVARQDMEAKALYEGANASGRVAILNAVPGYVKLLQRRYGLRTD